MSYAAAALFAKGEALNDSIEPAVEVRQMELVDVAPTYELGQQIFTADRWPTLYRTWDEYEVVSLYANERANCLVADNRGEIVGFAMGSILEKRGEPWTYGYLLWLGVSPRMKRRGLGRQLIDELTVRFIDAGARMMLVDTEDDNHAALALFRRVGFGHERPHVYLSRNLTNHPEYLRRKTEEI
jgi:ribosomal protein S18 acetylase RimI-like enzyme